jgi:hypothetical protein
MTVDDLSTPFLSSITRIKGILKANSDISRKLLAVCAIYRTPDGHFNISFVKVKVLFI